MRNEIRDSLLDVTPDLKESKNRINRAVLQPKIRSKKNHLFPRIIFSCFLLMSIFLISTELKHDNYVSGFSNETLNMYNLLTDDDPTEQYHKDLTILRYGELEGIKLRKEAVKSLVTSYTNELPANFERVLKENGISYSAYKEQYLTLKAQVQLVFDSELPYYKNLYPQFPEVVHGQLLLLDAMEKINKEDLSFGNQVSIPAVVLYESENVRILSLIEEKRLVEEQLIIMPKRDSLNLNLGDKVLLENNLISSVSAKGEYKQFIVSQNVKVTTENEITEIPVMPKKLNDYFEQNNWEPLSLTEKPDMQLKTLKGTYSVWFRDGIIIGQDGKGFVITKEELQNWGKKLIND